MATLLQPRRLATPLLLERLDRFTIGLKWYSECIAAAVPFLVCSLDSDGPRSERGRKTDLRQNVSFSQIWPTYDRTLPAIRMAHIQKL